MIRKRRASGPRSSTILTLAAFVLGVSASVCIAQDCPPELSGAWTASLPARDLFQVRLTVREQTGGDFEAEFRSAQTVETVSVWWDGTHLRFQSARIPVAFDGQLSDDRRRIGGFVKHASSVGRLELARRAGAGTRRWAGDWSPLEAGASTVRLDLYIGGNGDGGGMGGFFFFRDPRLPALFGRGLDCQGGVIRLGEKNLGLEFEGKLERRRDQLAMTVTGLAGSLPITFERMPQDLVPARPDAPEVPPRPAGEAGYVERAPEARDDGWPTARPSEVGIDPDTVGAMVRAIVEGELPLTHSVLVARHGRLIVEEYFYGFDRDTWHDMRSASKTLASTLIGLAIAQGDIEDVSATALSFFPRYRHYDNWDPRKARITVRDLLTMSSGLDANDADPGSMASESAYQSQTRRPDWIQLALDAPMITDPGSQPLYGSANPLILGGILAHAVDEPVERFAHRALLGPLGIEHYKFVLDPTGVVYMGGGMHMRPRDMAKYGQLYLNGGVWNGRRILSDEWVRESWGRYGRLAPLDRNGHHYGYLWWHHEYEVGDRTIRTLEARGFGGQYIFVVPSLDLVVVITAGNFRTGKTRQPEEILGRFVLPAVVPGSAGQ